MKQLAFESLVCPLTVREFVLDKLRGFQIRQLARDARRAKARRKRARGPVVLKGLQPEPHVGQTWRRSDGSEFLIERIERGYVSYWLSNGSRPQYREIRIECLRWRYKLVSPR